MIIQKKASPEELRARAKAKLQEWRELRGIDNLAADDARDEAANLAMLAAEADEAKVRSASMGRMGE